MKRVMIRTVLAAATVAVAALAPAVAQNGQTFSFGYPSVAEAYAALSAHADMHFVEADGWLQAQEPQTQAVWSFSHEGDPAHPTGVRRAFFGHGANVKIITNMRCEAAKAACDAVAAAFQQRSMKMRQGLRDSYAAAVARRGYHPTPAQDKAARAAMDAFFAAIDGSRFDDAYAMLDDSLRAAATRAQFADMQAKMHDEAGSNVVRDGVIVTWYHDPPNTPAGTYAAFDVDARTGNGRSWSETLIARQRADGSFAVLRHARDVMELPGPISVVGAH